MTTTNRSNGEGASTRPRFVPLTGFREYPPDEVAARADQFYAELARRRTVRHFSERPIPREVIERCILTAGTAPSGANLQPWRFVAVVRPETKAAIRVAAEAEEKEFYAHRAPPEWLKALKAIGTTPEKPFLETAPCLIAVFEERYSLLADGSRRKHYYSAESTGLATGLLIAAFHHAGLATLTHTPSPMGFLREILKRPENERPYLLLVVGYPADDAVVPDLSRKKLSDIAHFVD